MQGLVVLIVPSAINIFAPTNAQHYRAEWYRGKGEGGRGDIQVSRYFKSPFVVHAWAGIDSNNALPSKCI